MDQGALRAAKALGIKTGGVAPAGYKTEMRQMERLLKDVYGLEESKSRSYVARTYANVELAHGTVWIGEEGTPGWRCTSSAVRHYNSFLLHISPSFLRSNHSKHLDTVRLDLSVWLRLLSTSHSTVELCVNVAQDTERARGAWHRRGDVFVSGDSATALRRAAMSDARGWREGWRGEINIVWHPRIILVSGCYTFYNMHSGNADARRAEPKFAEA